MSKIRFLIPLLAAASVTACLKSESKSEVKATVQNSELFRGYSWTPGWPSFPRSTMEIVEERINDSKISIGPDINAFGVKWKNSFTTKFSMSWKMVTTLLKHGEKVEILNKDDTMNVEDGVEFVGLCLYQASTDTGIGWETEFSVGFGSVGNELQGIQKIVVSQSSNFFNIRASDTLSSVQDKCRLDFQRRVKPSVIQQLAQAVKINYADRIRVTDPNVSDWVRAADVAKFGPDVWLDKPLVLPTRDPNGLQSPVGMKWNVRMARQGAIDGAFEVTGLLKHKDGLFKYGYMFIDGQSIDPEFETDITDPKVKAEAVRVSLILANEVYLEYREEYVPIVFEDYVKLVSEENSGFKSNAYGRIGETGRQENSFDDSRITSGQADSSDASRQLEISKIEVQHNDKIIGINTTLRSGEELSHAFNKNATNTSSLELGPNEYIVSIDVSLGPDTITSKMRIYGLIIQTNTGRSLTAGVPTQDHETIYAANGKQITGFYGNIDVQNNYISQFGAVFSDRDVSGEVDRISELSDKSDLSDLESLDRVISQELGGF